jgi:PAS domain S-box-containing protein
MIAGGAPMQKTLETLLRAVERQSPDLLASILLLDVDGEHVRPGAAPSLPKEFVQAIDGLSIGPNAGSCGTAIFRREPVLVADIASDPLWTDYKSAALAQGLRACWSTPVFDAQKNILGTFAIYQRQPGLPTEWHRHLIETAAQTAAVCIAKHQADASLQASEAALRASIENTPNVAVQWYDLAGRVTFWNHASEKIFGWSAAEAGGKTLDQLIFTPEQAAEFLNLLKQTAESGDPIGPREFAFQHRSGAAGITLSTIFRIPVPTGELRFVCMDVDITARKQAEAEREAFVAREQKARTEYTLRLIASQEAERKRIAAELHDSLGQNLLLIKNLAQRVLREKTLEPAQDQLTSINYLATLCIAEARQISRDLHPPQLDHLGLQRALELMLETTAQASETKFTWKFDVVDELFPAEAAMSFYRIVQESLNNILKHSHAKNARVEMERDIHEVRLLITDDGCGYAARSLVETKDGMGLRNLDERARMLGGTLQMDSAPGRGTRLTLTVPIRETAD